MDQQKLPNVTLAIVLSILGFVCCCIGGLPAIILSGISLIVLNNDKKKYIADPEKYSNYSTFKTARIISIIVMVMGILYLLFTIFRIVQLGGIDGMTEEACRVYSDMGIEMPFCD
jgi:hypothetical protein